MTPEITPTVTDTVSSGVATPPQSYSHWPSARSNERDQEGTRRHDEHGCTFGPHLLNLTRPNRRPQLRTSAGVPVWAPKAGTIAVLGAHATRSLTLIHVWGPQLRTIRSAGAGPP